MAERADIDHFFVRSGGIERRISHKQRMLCRAPNGGVAEYRVPDDLVDKPVLSDAEIDQIAKLAETAERLFAAPRTSRASSPPTQRSTWFRHDPPRGRERWARPSSGRITI